MSGTKRHAEVSVHIEPLSMFELGLKGAQKSEYKRLLSSGEFWKTISQKLEKLELYSLCNWKIKIVQTYAYKY